MAEYYVMLARKYKISVRQYVVFLGPSKPAMNTRLDDEHMTFDFPLISFSELDYHIFLRSSQPEEIVFGVLADFKGDSPEKALKQIVQRIEETATGDFPLKRYFKQLRVLAQLRNLGENLKDITMDSISKFVSVEKDAAYLIGLNKGEEKGETKGEAKAEIRFVKNLLAKMSLTVEQIADIAGVSVDFVRTIAEKQS